LRKQWPVARLNVGGQIDQFVEQSAGFHQRSLDSSVASGTGLFEVSMVNSSETGGWPCVPARP
jgi:hypothetical protein